MPDDNGITLAEAKAGLAAWLAADAAVSQGQEYRINFGGTDRLLRRADAAMIADRVSFWETKVRRLATGGIRVRGVTF